MITGSSWFVRRSYVALIVALIVETAIAIACQGDFIASDPLWYANLANEIATHPGQTFAAPSNHPFEMRIGLTVPLALMYRAFGVSRFVTNLPCLLGALGVLLVTYAAAPTPRAKLLGMLVVVTSTVLVRQTSFLNVDLPCAALMTATVLFLSRRDQPRGAWYLIAAMVTWFAAFLVKETALWLVPVWIYAFACDLPGVGARRVARAFAPAIVVGCVLGISYLALCAWIWGDPLARFHGIQELTGHHRWAIDDQPTSAWTDRLLWAPLPLLAKLFRAALVPIVLAAWFVRGPQRIWWFATVSIALWFWFGSSSLSVYSPLPLLPRMAMPVVTMGLVLAALASDRILDRLQGSRWRMPILIVFLAALVIPSVLAIRTTIIRPRPETDAYAVVREATSHPDRRVRLVCGDPRCEAITGIYFGFDLPPNLVLSTTPGFAAGPRPTEDRVFAIIDLRRVPKPPGNDSQGYQAQKLVALGLPELVSDRDVRLYDAGDGQHLWDALRAGR